MLGRRLGLRGLRRWWRRHPPGRARQRLLVHGRDRVPRRQARAGPGRGNARRSSSRQIAGRARARIQSLSRAREAQIMGDVAPGRADRRYGCRILSRAASPDSAGDVAGAASTKPVHTGPAMLAAIVGADGRFSGLHITWLDLARPKGKAEVPDPTTGDLLPAKKVRGSKSGGRIEIVPRAAPRRLIIGEGIET